MIFPLLLAVYGTVFATELIGDRSLYTISTLTLRFRVLAVFCGLTVAYMAKMLVAVMIGEAMTAIPVRLMSVIGAATFFAAAFAIWRRKTTGEPRPSAEALLPRSIFVSFAAIFFTEWGDVGQVAAATLTAQYHAPVTVWLGASLALTTKGSLAIVLGRGLRKWITPRAFRYAAVSLCLIMGSLCAVQLLTA